MGLQILQWNCRSIQNKLAILQPTYHVYSKLIYIKTAHSCYVRYHFFRKDRPNCNKGGGACICIKNNVSFSEASIPASVNDLEIIAILVSGNLLVNKYNFVAHHKIRNNGTPNANGKRLINFFDSYGYTSLNITEPTYFSQD